MRQQPETQRRSSSFTSMSAHPQQTGIQDLPPEILASAFETLIYVSGSDISLILPLTLVCRSWHDIITSTPRLWGILTFHRKTDPITLGKCIYRAKASPLSITASPQMRYKHRETVKQIKVLANLVGNWVELNVGVEFLVIACDLDRNRKHEEEHGPLAEPVGCEPNLGWVDICRSLQSLTLERGGREHEFPGAFFTHKGGVISANRAEVKLRSFTSIGLPKPWIFGFLGSSIKSLRLLHGERARNPWGQANMSSETLFITLEDIHNILSRVPNATQVELHCIDAVISTLYLRPILPSSRNRVIPLPFLRDLTLRAVIHTALVLGAICAPNLHTLMVNGLRGNRTWGDPDQSLASVFATWSQPGFVMENLHTLELVNCFRSDDDDVIPSMIRWLHGLKSLVRLFIIQETQSPHGLEEAENEIDESEETHLFKALACPRISHRPGDQGAVAEWVCPSLMILRVDIPNTPLRNLISIVRIRGGIAPYPYALSSFDGNEAPVPHKPARLRSIETHFCGSGEQEEIELLRSIIDNPQCICMNCGLHLPLESLAVSGIDF